MANEKYAFFGEPDADGKVCVVIVGNVVDGHGEVLDANILADMPEAKNWAYAQIGPTKPVYTLTKH